MARQMAHFRYDPVKWQKIVKMSEGPTPIFCDMNGGIVVACRKIDQMTVTNPFDKNGFFVFLKKWLIR